MVHQEGMRMLKFKQFITEEKVNTKTQEHIEDRILQPNVDGLHTAFSLLNQAHEHIKTGSSDSKIIKKYDTNSSVVFGHNPNNGKFFVGTKSSFNTIPKINYTPEDIEKNHGNSEALSDNLKHSLEHLKKISPKSGVFEGDILYGKDGVKSDKNSLNFSSYNVDKASDAGKKITGSKIGVAVHTQYYGSHLNTMTPHFEPEVHKFKEHPDVHVFNSEVYPETSMHSAENETKFNTHMKAAMDAAVSAPHNTFPVTHGHSEQLKSYITKSITDGVEPNTEGFKQHLTDKHSKIIDGVKSESGKQRKRVELQGHMNHIDGNRKHYDSLFAIHNNLQQAKNALISSLNASEQVKGPVKYTIIHHGVPSMMVNRSELPSQNSLKVPNKKR